MIRLPLAARSSCLGLALFLGLSTAATAQEPPPMGKPAVPADMVLILHLAAHNQLGVMEYCQSNNYVGANAVALQRRQLQMLPAAQVPGEADAEAMGRKGIVAAGGKQVTLAQAAEAQSTTVQQLCQRIAQMAEEQAGQAGR